MQLKMKKGYKIFHNSSLIISLINYLFSMEKLKEKLKEKVKKILRVQRTIYDVKLK